MVRMMLVVALFLVGSAVRAEERAADVGSDTSKWVGTWVVKSAEKDGKREAASDVKGRKVKITRDTITCMDADGKTEMSCTFTADTSGKNAKLTMKCTKGENEGKTLKGIAHIDGDTLRICFSKPDKDAPTDFKAREGQCCYTLERSR
jgi:uncharacterized protein (TIGR03067 family)